MTGSLRLGDADIPDVLISLAQNDYMIDNRFLDTGRMLIVAASLIRTQEETIRSLQLTIQTLRERKID